MTAMDSDALLSGLVGALIGSFTSLATLVVQNHAQNRRESQRLLFETAYKDYELRILHAPEHQAAFPVILAYHQKMFELIESGRMTPAAAKEIFKLQADMSTAIQKAVQDLDSAAKSRSETHA